MILVTGADGLIGGRLCSALRSSGHDVAGFARSVRRGEPGHFDLREASVAELPRGVSVAVLCAWAGGLPEAAADPEGTWRTNVEGTLAFAERLRGAGVKLIFLSTSLVSSGPGEARGGPGRLCCEYARQNAAVEAAMVPGTDAVVRITKVGETLLPRLRSWGGTLRRGGRVSASAGLQVAPVMLADVVGGLGQLAMNFEAGLFQMSAGVARSYGEIALMLARRLAVPEALVELDARLPVEFDGDAPPGALAVRAPRQCPQWPDGKDVVQFLVEQAIS